MPFLPVFVIACLLLGGAALLASQAQRAPLPPPLPTPGTPGLPPVAQSVPAPASPGTTQTPGQPPDFEPLDPGPYVNLEHGQQYVAKIELTGLEAMFGSKGAVHDKLAELGFAGVLVWSRDPPPYVPDRAPFPSGDTYWAQGWWGKPSGSVERPEQIRGAWVNRGGMVGASPATGAWG